MERVEASLNAAIKKCGAVKPKRKRTKPTLKGGELPSWASMPKSEK